MKGALRNAPCPCGSGKKYKKCCLLKEQDNTSNLVWNKLRQTDEQLVPKLLQFAADLFGPDAINDAWDEFVNLHESIEFEPESIHNQAFIPWYMYTWDIQDWFKDSEDLGRRTIAGEYLAKRRKMISDMENRFIILNCTNAFSFYEILDCEQGTGYTLKDIFSGYTLNVTEKSGSQHTHPGDVIYAKTIKYDDVGMVIGSGAVIIPPMYKTMIIDLRANMREGKKFISNDDLHEWDDVIRDMYLEIYTHLMKPLEIRNTDGDELLIHNMTFKINSPQTTFDALKRLAGGIPEGELLETAVYDDQGELLSVELPWIKKNRKSEIGKEYIALGHMDINNKELKIFVNSEKRAKKIRREIDKRLSSQAAFLSMEVQSLEDAREKSEKTEKKKPELENETEMQEVRRQILESHWKNWIDDKIPALNGLTPRQAIKDEDGREKVTALLDDFDRRDKNSPINKSQKEYIQKVRKQLGLSISDNLPK